MDEPEVLSTVSRISEDFSEGNPPFDDVEFPEERLVREIQSRIGEDGETWKLTMEHRAQIATIFSTFDYNRDANQLVDNLLKLYERRRQWFDPASTPGSKKSIEYMFEEIGFRYPSRDAKGWHENTRIFRNKYNGRVTELMLSTQCDAVQLVERLNDDGFMYLKGDKIAPMYARILSDEVAELRNLWKLEIPVDTHIRRLTQDLCNAEMSDDDIRRWWRNVGPAADIERHTVDGGLWLIGNNWDEWGEEYWHEVTEEP